MEDRRKTERGPLLFPTSLVRRVTLLAGVACLAPLAGMAAALALAGASAPVAMGVAGAAACGALLGLAAVVRALEPLGDLARDLDGFTGPERRRTLKLDEVGRIAAGVDALSRRLEAAVRRGDPARLDDPITGLPNRLAVMRRARDEITRARRKGAALSVALFEVDRLEDIARASGQADADIALRLAAELSVQSLRAYDVVGRWEGAAFVILMPEAEVEHAVAAMRRIRAQIEQARIAEIEGAPATGVAGVAVLQPDDATLADIAIRAQRALNRAKAGFGGGVEAAPGPRTRPAHLSSV